MNEIYKNYIGRYSGVGDDFARDGEKPYNYQDGPPINLNLNSFGFRSKEISVLDNNNINILVSGCSNSWGDSILEHNMWSNYLYEHFKLFNNNINVDNISYPGASIHAIIRNINAFINNYGSPNYLFIVFPSLSRNLYFLNNKNGFANVFLFDNYSGKQIKVQREYNKQYVRENNILQTTTFLYMLESLCESKNIKLLWTSWDEEDCILFDTLNFNNFINIKNIDNISVENTNNDPYWLIGKDNVHFGAEWHKKISYLFFENIKYGIAP